MLISFLTSSFQLEDEDAKWAWLALRDLVWKQQLSSSTESLREASAYVPLFVEYGLSRGLGMRL